MLNTKQSPLQLSLKLQEVCDGLTSEQLKVRQQQQDQLVWSARERVLSANQSKNSPYVSARDRILSAKSNNTRGTLSRERASPGKLTIEDSLSPRTASRLSLASEGREDDQRSEYSQRSNINSPDLYNEHDRSLELIVTRGTQEYNAIAKAQTLPDIEMRQVEQHFLYDEPGIESYSSINGVFFPKRKLCSRSKSAMENRYDHYTGSLSRQCCDVLGPKVCRDCALIKRRLYDRHRHERPLTRLEVSEKNFADSITLSKSLPGLAADEIEDKVLSGEILRASLRQRLQLKRERTILENRRLAKSAPSTEQQKPKENQWNGVSTTFFMNIRDLNNKILIGKLTNKLHHFQDPSNDYYKADDGANSKALVPQLNPPPAATEHKLRPISYYDPPLVPKVCQSSEPSFFAGSSDGYKLPDRLPDRVVEDQIDDFSAFEAAWSRVGSSKSQSENEAETTT